MKWPTPEDVRAREAEERRERERARRRRVYQRHDREKFARLAREQDEARKQRQEGKMVR